MRNGSPQGYSGRRAPNRGNGGQAMAGEIWEVVSALANALQDARNQLVNLMNTSQRGDTGRLQSPGRFYGGRPGSNSHVETVGEAYQQQRGTLTRNVHRNHAHGHVAFGLNSEFPVMHATPRRQRAQSVMSAAQRLTRAPIEPAASTPRRCNHPLHHMGAAARSLTPRRAQTSGQTSWPSSRVADCRKSNVDDLSRRDRACVNISSRGRSQLPGGDPKNSSGAARRQGNCLGTQFISLLKQEAFQIRERRLAEESCRDRRPGWSRC